MDAVSAAASVAGLLGLVGQCLDGILKLREFFESAKRAPKTIKALMEELAALDSILEQVRTLLKSLQDRHGDLVPAPSILLDELCGHIRACERDAGEWARVAQDLDPGSWKGLKAFFRKAKIAAGQNLFSEFQNKIADHQRKISLGLSVLGRSMDSAGLAKLDKIGLEISDLKEAHQRLNDTLATDGPARETNSMQEIQEMIQDMKEHQQETHKQMRSIAGSISSLGTKISRLTGSTAATAASCPQAVSNSPQVKEIPDRNSLKYDLTDEPDTSHLRPAGFVVFPAKTDTSLVRPPRRRRTGPLSAIQRERAALIRKLGQCEDCRRRRVACQPGHHNTTWEELARKYQTWNPDSADPSIATKPETKWEWTCDSLSGIDEAFSNDVCLFCGENVDYLDSHERGRHLVEAHQFGRCNQDALYSSVDLTSFEKHLRAFHCSENPNTISLMNTLRRLKDPLRAVRLRDCDPPEIHANDTAGLRDESPQTSLILQARMDQVIYCADVLPDVSLVEYVGTGLFARALRRLDQLPLSPPPESRMDKMFFTFEAACIEEEMVVSGHENLVVHRRPPDYESLIAYLTKITPGKESCQSVATQLFSNAWVCHLPGETSDESSSTAAEFYGCAECARNHLYDTQDEALEHLRTWHVRLHSDGSKRPLERCVEEIPLQLCASWVTSRSVGRGRRDTIHRWLRGLFMESSTFRTLLRTSKAAATDRSLGSSAREWTLSVLDRLDTGIINDSMLVDEERLNSDGAVDSRDDLKSCRGSSSLAFVDEIGGQSKSGGVKETGSAKRLPSEASDRGPVKKARAI